MTSSAPQPFEDLILDHVEFYVSELAAKTDWYVDTFGFAVHSATGSTGTTEAIARSVGLGGNGIRLVLTEATDASHPGAGYVQRHGDGVSDIALRVADAAAAFDEAVRRGATPVAAPAERDGIVTATITGFGDVVHTFVQRPAGADQRALPGLRPGSATPGSATPGSDRGLGEIDHFAVCVPAGQIDATVEAYQRILDFELIFTERIAVGAQAMTTKVVQSRSGSVTFTLIEPDVTRVAGHIDEFLRDHGGAGVQHIAFTASNIVESVDAVRARGVEFLGTPASYYSMLPLRVELDRYPLEELQRLSILVDEDHDGQLCQIFMRSVHPRNTIFFELIERLGARSFGSGNIAALYQAVELERAKDKAHDQAA